MPNTDGVTANGTKAPPPPPRTVIVSGRSGSGKTTALRALEDVGFFCIDNLPVVLLEQVMGLREHADLVNVAVVVDVRELTFLPEYAETVQRIRAAGDEVETLFLNCTEEVSIRRFKETRRMHPLQGDGSISDGLKAERKALEPVRAVATYVVDTSSYNVHELRLRVQEIMSPGRGPRVHVRIDSFGFKHGTPREMDFMFDVRFLPNPYFDDALRAKTGLDPDVFTYVQAHPDTQELQSRILHLLELVIPRVADKGRATVTVGIGCTGGQHRSVAVAQWLHLALASQAHCRCTVQHRDIGRSEP